MSRIVFLLEEYSMKVLLEGLLPRHFPELNFLCLSHQGKQDLEKSIPRKLRAWQEPGVRFVVLRDNDGADCRILKQKLVDLAREGGREDTLVRIACQELEAWYFGDTGALAREFLQPDLQQIAGKARFRDPDAIDQPSKALADLVAEFQKVSGARRMAKQLTQVNGSHSYRALLAGIERLMSEMAVAVATNGGDFA